MQIIHKINEFLYSLFPTIAVDDYDALIKAVAEYYTIGPHKPVVSLSLATDSISIDIDLPSILSQDADYKKALLLCEKGMYAAAKPLLLELIKANPSYSEYHRIMGQILSEEGEQEEATNYLIDALRWDPKNGWALTMMGNIFSRYKKDIETALLYYDQALVANPTDHITMNNIGANLMRQDKLLEAKKYFEQANSISNNYPNTLHALGLIAEMEKDLKEAFDYFIEAIRCNPANDVLFNNSVNKAIEVAKTIATLDIGKSAYEKYRHRLEVENDRIIALVKSDEIPTAAKIEFAENYDRDSDIVKYKAGYPAVEHLIMHELVHLDLVLQARERNSNQLFISTQEHKASFTKGLQPTINKFKKMGLKEEQINSFCSSLFDGINSQTYNAPIDLFIEDYLYEQYEEIRPYQFLSLIALIQEGIKAVTDKQVVELTPRDIISKSKTYNLVLALQFKELYGIDFIADFSASQIELKRANEFFEEFKEYRVNKEPAEEYELVKHWAEDLNLDKNFELVDENEFRKKRVDAESILSAIEEDPFDLETKDSSKEKEMEKFQQKQKELGINMAVVLFMVEALAYFEGRPKEEIKATAFEIAMQGTQGYSPDKDNYRISSIKGKQFSGYHILAYYYVSWAIAAPEMLSKLQLPYDEEYKLALTMNKSNPS